MMLQISRRKGDSCSCDLTRSSRQLDRAGVDDDRVAQILTLAQGRRDVSRQLIRIPQALEAM